MPGIHFHLCSTSGVSEFQFKQHWIRQCLSSPHHDTMGVDRSLYGGSRYDVAAVYAPGHRVLRQRKSPSKPSTPLPTRFPDEDHTFHPLRRVHAAKIANTLPPPSPSLSSPRSSPSTRGPSTRRRLANLADSELWGFPVRYSPQDELREQWELAVAREAEAVAQLQAEETARGTTAARAENQKHQAELTRQDYMLYLYLASKYGPLDAILYCCTPFPGRLYALMVDQCARRLQRWQRHRVRALRLYWVHTLADQVVEASVIQGSVLALRALDHQRNAAMFLRQLRWRVAASAFRSWYQYTQRQIEVRWRFQFAMDQVLRARFERWKQRVDDLRTFKHQLKTVARRKQLHAAWERWQAWQATQQRVRIQIHQQWTKLQCECLTLWRANATTRRRHRRAATCIQRNWRVHRLWRWSHGATAASIIIGKLIRGFVARRRVLRRRDALVVVQTMEKIVRVIEWDALVFDAEHERAQAVNEELEVASQLAQVVQDAEQSAAEYVRSELSRVRKNELHHRLQRKIRELQDTGLPDSISDGSVGRRTRSVEAVTLAATQLIIDEDTAAARRRALADCSASLPPNRRSTRGFSTLCAVCVAASVVAAKLDVPWVHEVHDHVALGRCVHSPLLSAVDPTDVASLRPMYQAILSFTTAYGATVRHEILSNIRLAPLHSLLKAMKDYNNCL